MSRVTKLKHLQRELDSDDLSLPIEKQQIVRIISSRGNNLHEVESSDPAESNYLVSMPSKYRKNVWIKRGDFVLVEQIQEGEKVKAEIVRILTVEHQKEYTKESVWPRRFTKKREHEDEIEVNSNSSDDDNLPANPNRKHFNNQDEDDDTDSSSENE